MTVAGETFQERAKGKDVRQSNIVAAKAVANAIRTSLGPRGMDKLMQLSNNEVLISNDGATILSKMHVVHPAAKMLVELSQSQDVEAGDGTTSVCVIAGALLDAAGTLLDRGIHPTSIASAFTRAAVLAEGVLRDRIAQRVDLTDREALIGAVKTCLASKVVSQNSDVLAPIAVDSVLAVVHGRSNEESKSSDSSDSAYSTTTNVDLRNIRIVKQIGGTIDDSEFIHGGLVLSKGSTQTAGGPSQISNAKIALIQYCLSAPKTDMDNSVVISDYAAMDRILREERKYILQQCKLIKKSGANVLLIQKSILRDAYNELSLHFLAKMGILVVTDVERADVEFICHALGCQPVAHAEALKTNPEHVLGSAAHVGDVVMPGSNSRVVKFTGVAHPGGAVTVLLRGSNALVLEEADRSLHDAQCVVRCLVKERYLVAGGGAPEIEVAVRLREMANSLQGGGSGGLGRSSGDSSPMRKKNGSTGDGKEADADGSTSIKTSGSGPDAYCIKAFADALEVVPYTLAENAGLKPIEIVTELRKRHAVDEEVGAGINVKKGAVTDMYGIRVIQPLLVTTSAIHLATETVCMILKIDDLMVVA